MVRPVMPIIEYEMNKEYIASVLCENRARPVKSCNGKCYLQKRLQTVHKSVHTSNKEPIEHSTFPPKIDFEKYPISDLLDSSFSLLVLSTSKQHFYAHTEGKPLFYIVPIEKPPLV